MLKVLTLILQLDIINCIWIKLWFSISPWEDRGILDKKYICVHMWLFFLWSNGSQSVAPRQSISIACTCYKCRFSGPTSDFLDQKLRVGPSSLCSVSVLVLLLHTQALPGITCFCGKSKLDDTEHSRAFPPPAPQCPPLLCLSFARLVLSVFVLINGVDTERCKRTKCV